MLASLPVLALDIETSTDVSVTVNALSYPEGDLLPLEFQGPSYQLNGSVTAFWNIQAYPTNDWVVDFRYGLGANSILDGAGAEEGNVSTVANYRSEDLPAALDVGFSQELDRLNVTWYSPFGDYSIGRQPISFGQAKVISPIDVIQPAAIVTTDRSYRPGVDAIRGTWLVGAVSELDAGYVFGEDTAAFARLKAFLFGSDIELVGIQINDDHQIVSFGTNSALGNVGVWQESAILISEDEEEIRASLGVDYTFFDDLYVLTELHYNGLGDPENYLNAFANSFYQLGAVTPWAQWYVSTQGSYPINILTQVTGGVTVNLDDGSALLNSIVSYNATQSLSVNAIGILPIASENSLEYEYGAYPTSLAVELDWVF
jgi:hypothetical protein